MREDLVEIVARALCQSSWGDDTDDDEVSQFHKDALAALRAIEGAGMKVVGREPCREMWAASGDAVCDLQQRGIGHHDKITEAVWQAAFDAAPAFGGGE